jgi:hypothetical protein
VASSWAHRVHHADERHDEDLVGDRDERGGQLLDGEGLGLDDLVLAAGLGGLGLAARGDVSVDLMVPSMSTAQVATSRLSKMARSATRSSRIVSRSSRRVAG